MIRGRQYDSLKRAIDFVIGGAALALSIPLQVLVGLAVRHCLGAPVLFRQQRPGKDEQIFELVKFRTMLEPDPGRGLITDEQRMTRLGTFLRSASLDELPSLWNVVKGDMSLVGPRPLLVRYLERYTPGQTRRHEVRPGVTGLAQVSGRNAISWDEKFEKDIEYVDQRSLGLDLRILAATVMKVLRRDGISDAETVTMAEFMRSQDSRG